MNISYQVYSISTTFSFKCTENKHDVHRDKDYMKKFCKFLKVHAVEIINFKKRKFKLLANEKQKSYQNAKICYIWEEKFEDKHAKYKTCCKVMFD